MEEIYKIIKGFDSYQVSNRGSIKSFKRNKNGILLKPILGSRGYLLVNIMKGGSMYQISIHRTVAEHFVDNPYNLPLVNHKDLDKTNNKENNLEWIDERGNVSHYYDSILTTSKYTGVYLSKGKYIAQLNIEKTRYHIGSYIFEDEAGAAYKKHLEIYNEGGLEAFLEYRKLLRKK